MGPIMRTLRFAALLLSSAPFVASSPPEDPPLRKVIDDELRAGWARENLAPARPSDDAEFLRRAFLDLAGTIPAADEARAFLEDADPAKRTKLVDRLLDDPRYAEQQAAVWDLVLFGRNPPNDVRLRAPFRKWLTEKFAKNEPYDRWVRELLLAEGNTLESGAPWFYLQFRGRPLEAAVAVSRVFMGTQLQCAQCHDHPADKWTQRDFYGLAAFFVRLTVVDGGGAEGKKKIFVGEKSTGEIMFTGPVTEQKPGQKGEPVPPAFLGGGPLSEPALPAGFKEPDFKGPKEPPKPLFSRREKLAERVTSPENLYFTKAAVNRLWAQFMGRGLVHPVDDLKEAREPSHPRLFQILVERLAASRFDLKAFIREIVNSEAYQLSSAGSGEPRAYERMRLRPLTAEEMLSAVRVATGYDAGSSVLMKPGEEKLPSAAGEYFVRHFGSVTDGRGEFHASISERLFMNNGGTLRQFIQRRKGNLADLLLSSPAPGEERVDRLFLSVLSRRPRPDERERFAASLKDGARSDALVEEAIWALLNCGEFRFNH